MMSLLHTETTENEIFYCEISKITINMRRKGKNKTNILETRRGDPIYAIILGNV